jgi:tetratricopeptide (TPR) repeat protein
VGYQEMELAATYLLKGQEVYDNIEQPNNQSYDDWMLLGEVLFHCRDYEKSIFYTRRVIEHPPVDSNCRKVFFLGRVYNTMGQNFDQLGKWDSALYYYKQSMSMAKRVNEEVWIAINAGFIGGIYLKAKDYVKSKTITCIQLQHK